MSDMFKPVEGSNLPVKKGFWSSFKAFWLQDVTVELTPAQQKVENEINDFLYQEVTLKKVHDFLFQEVTFGKSQKNTINASSYGIDDKSNNYENNSGSTTGWVNNGNTGSTNGWINNNGTSTDYDSNNYTNNN